MNFTQEKLCLSIIQSASDAIVCKDIAGKILSLNPSAERLFGYSENELIGQNISVLIPPQKQEEEKKAMESIMWGESVENFETERVSKSGKTITVSINLSPIKDDSGKTIGICSFIKNISERKKAQGKSQAILESAPDAMVIVNKFGQIVLVNAQTEKLFGYSREELIGKEVEILIPGRFKDKHPEHRKKYFSDPRARPMEQGIDKEFQHKIFVIFQRLHNVNEYPGTGIGLATCKKIIEMNGGRIWLESEPGIGSAFYFSLPKSKKSI